MIEYFHLSNDCFTKAPIEQERLLKKASEKKLDVHDLKTIKTVEMLASIRPEIVSAAAFKDNNRIYDEIQIIQVEFSDHSYMLTAINTLMRLIPYPMIVLIKEQSKYSVCLSKPTINKSDYEKNRISGFFRTKWFFPDNPTGLTNEILLALNLMQYSYTSLFELYTQLYNRLLIYRSDGMTQTEFSKMITHFIGRCQSGEKKQLLDSCTPFPVQQHCDMNAYVKYSKKALNKYNYIYKYDFEDVWHAVLQNQRSKEFLTIKNLNTASEMIQYWREFKWGERDYVDQLHRG